jgi:hypothetical protein
MSEITNLAVERLFRLVSEQNAAQEKFLERMLSGIHSFNDWSVVIDYKITKYLETNDKQWLLEARKTCAAIKGEVEALVEKLKEGEKK